MTSFHKNGFIDLETHKPVGLYPQQVKITGHNIEGTLAVTFNPENGKKIVTMTDKAGNKQAVPYQYQNINGKHVFSMSSGGDNPQILHVSIGEQDITVDAQNFPDAQQEFGNHQLTFRADGGYSVRSNLQEDGRAKTIAVVQADGRYIKREDMKLGGKIEESKGSEYGFYPSMEGRISYLNFFDQYDQTQQGSTLFAKKVSPFNVAVVDTQTGQYFASERHQERRNFMAMHDGQWGRVDLIINNPNGGLASGLGLNSARFYPHDAAAQKELSPISISVDQALEYEKAALAQLSEQLHLSGIIASPLPVDEPTAHYGGLPKGVIDALDIKDTRVDGNRDGRRR